MSRQKAFNLFVGNLPWTVSRKELSEYFGQFGILRSSSVVFDTKTGLSKGYGFVEFTHKNGYQAAVSQDNHILENSKLTLGLGARGGGDKQSDSEGSD